MVVSVFSNLNFSIGASLEVKIGTEGVLLKLLSPHDATEPLGIMQYYIIFIFYVIV